jgi:hypothetical protein
MVITLNAEERRMRYITVAVTVVALACVASPAKAFDVQDGAKLPPNYAREVETKDKDGKTVKTLSFNGSAATIPPADLHTVLTCYGLQVVDGSKLPASYAREVETKDKDGKTVKTLAFNGTAATIPPADLHAILTAYGARVGDGAKLPASYAREVETKDKDGKTVKTLAFNGSAATLPPWDLHTVLTAYTR